MSEAIGRVFGQYAPQSEYGSETMINNYLISKGLPPLANYQANQSIQPSDNINAIPTMLAEGLRQAYPKEIAKYELDRQVENLQDRLSDNPALQQQYADMLAQALAAKLNGEDKVTSQPQTTPILQQNSTESKAKQQWSDGFAKRVEA